MLPASGCHPYLWQTALLFGGRKRGWLLAAGGQETRLAAGLHAHLLFRAAHAEFKKIAYATAIGFFMMGFIGFFVKLVHIPINNIIVYAIANASFHRSSLSWETHSDSTSSDLLPRLPCPSPRTLYLEPLRQACPNPISPLLDSVPAKARQLLWVFAIAVTQLTHTTHTPFQPPGHHHQTPQIALSTSSALPWNRASLLVALQSPLHTRAQCARRPGALRRKNVCIIHNSWEAEGGAVCNGLQWCNGRPCIQTAAERQLLCDVGPAASSHFPYLLPVITPSGIIQSGTRCPLYFAFLRCNIRPFRVSSSLVPVATAWIGVIPTNMLPRRGTASCSLDGFMSPSRSCQT